jgi:hypothetical protein
MAKQRKKRTPPRPKVKPAAAKTLIDHTRQGIDALRSRRAKRSAKSSKADPKAQAFGEALDRLKADYERLLKRGR